MGQWINLNLTGGGIIRCYEFDLGEDFTQFMNIDVSNWMGGDKDVLDQASCTRWKNAINGFLSRVNGTDILIGLHNTLPNGGTVTYVDSQGNPVVTVPYIATKIVYATALINGSAWGTNKKVTMLTSDHAYPSYQAVEDTMGSGNRKYSCGMKFLLLKDVNDSYPYPHIIQVDECNYMTGPDGGMSFDGDIGASYHTSMGNMLDRYNEAFINTSIQGLCHDRQRGKDYLLELVGEFNPDGSLSPKYYGDFSQLGSEYDVTGAILDVEPTQEDGYVNELDNRFSPRTHSIMTGMYVAFADTIAGVEDYQMSEIASALMTFDLGDAIRKTFLGTDGKEFIISVNWFYGIRAGLAAKNMILGPSDFRVGGQWPKAGLTPGHVVPLNNVGTEYFLWETPELNVGHKFGDYRDYLANYKIFLPYYGFVDIDPNDAVDAYIKIYYNINMLSRAADIVITTRSSRTNNQTVKIMSLSTTVGVEVPFGADACKSMMLAVAQTAGKAITTAASVYLGARGGQIGAAIASNSAANAYDTSMMNASIMSGNNVVDLNAASKGVTDKLSENASLRNQAAGIKAAQNAIPDMPNMALPSTTRSNGSGSENGSLDELHPYMLIEWPVTCEPNDWEDYVGIPASASTYLTANLGFTQVGAVHPDSMVNAPKYIDEIIAQLKVGVYL